MRLGVSWVTWGGVLGYPGGVLGLSDRLIQVSTSYSFHKNLLYFLSNQHLQSSRSYK